MFNSFNKRKKPPKSRPISKEVLAKEVKKQRVGSAGSSKIPETLLKIGKYISEENLNALYIHVSDESSYIIVGKGIYIGGRIYNTQDHESNIESFIGKLIKKLHTQAISEKDIESGIDELIKKVYKLGSTEEVIKKAGTKLYGLFFHEKNPSFDSIKFDSIKYVWVDCKLKKINPYWEWLHSGNSFWGDTFIINRTNTEDFKDFKSEKLDISNGTAIQDTDDLCAANDDGYCFKDLLATFKLIEIKDLEDNDLKGGDCIHFGLGRKAFDSSMGDALKRSGNDISSKLLFLNICKSKDVAGTQDILSELMTKSRANVCIYTSLDVPDKEANTFVKYFYKNFENGEKNAAEAVKESRIGFKNAEYSHRFWRLAYVIFGNPFIKLKFRR